MFDRMAREELTAAIAAAELGHRGELRVHLELSAVLLAFSIPLVASYAFGLAQSKHKSLSYSGCRAVDLPMDFCDEVAAAAYNVDRYEWDDLAAHAQPEAGQAHCDAALAVTGRVRTLAMELRTLLEDPKATNSRQSIEDIAKALGRTLHTVQDNCAHSGVPNVQHAWLSLSDTCLDTESSPDIQPAAVECAKKQTAVTLEAFVTAYEGVSLKTSSFKMYKEDNEQISMYWPPRGGVCDFLKSADTWDGTDRRWNNDLVVPAIEYQFYSNLNVDPATPAADVCAGDPNAIDAPEAAPVDVSKKIEWCTSIKLYCAGKSDGADALPPWETEAPAPTPTPSGGAGESSGCNINGSQSSWPAAFFAALGLCIGLRRRRRLG